MPGIRNEDIKITKFIVYLQVSKPSLFPTQESVKISRENSPDLKRISPSQKKRKKLISFHFLFYTQGEIMIC